MRPSTLVKRLLNRMNRSDGAHYALQAFDCLDEDTRTRVVADIKRYASASDAASIETNLREVFRNLMLYQPIFRTLFYVRCGNGPANPKLDKLVRACAVHLPADERMEIYAKEIGGGLLIKHSPVVIGVGTVIGENVTLGSDVMISKRHERYPVIHDRVSIAARSTVLGDIEIGEDAVVGACSLVLKSIPPRCVYAGNPAQLLHERADLTD